MAHFDSKPALRGDSEGRTSSANLVVVGAKASGVENRDDLAPLCDFESFKAHQRLKRPTRSVVREDGARVVLSAPRLGVPRVLDQLEPGPSAEHLAVSVASDGEKLTAVRFVKIHAICGAHRATVPPVANMARVETSPTPRMVWREVMSRREAP